MQSPEAQSQPDEVEPYPGLQPFTEGESSFFFGRDRLKQQITSNLRASRLTVIFGSSGVGKTSVLRAGVLPHLRRQARDAIEAARASASARPANLPVYFAGWEVDPVEAIPSAVARAVEEAFGHPAAEPASDTDLEGHFLRRTQETGCRLLIILDQFEEYFVYPRDEPNRFGRELGAAIGRADLPVNVLISIREDVYASLDRFKAELPQIFANTLRVDHLDRDDAEQAITGPLQQYNRLHPDSAAVSAEPKLVERVLREAATGAQPSLNDNAGRAGTTVNAQLAQRDRIQAPYLQLVMARLWSEDRSAGSAELREATLERLGGSRRIWGHHLNEALDTLSNEEQEDASQLFRYLVTPAGTKFAYTLSDLAALAGVPPDQATKLVEFLADRRQSILRPIEPAEGQTEARYEISHDLLGEAILDWRRRYEEARRTREAERQLEAERLVARARVARTRRRALLGTVVGAALVAAFAFFAFDAQRDAQQARSRELLATARQLAEVNRAAALETALEAWDLDPTAEAESTVRLTLSRLPLRGAAGQAHSDGAWSAAFDASGERVVSAGRDGRALVIDPTSGEVLTALEGHTDEVSVGAFTPDGREVVTASQDGTVRIWNSDTGTERLTLKHDMPVFLGSSPFSPDGKYVVSIANGTAFVWDVATGERIAEVRHGGDAEVLDAAFSPTRAAVATAGTGGITKLWELESNGVSDEPLHEFDNFTAWVNMVAFSSDGTLLANANSDGSVGVFDSASAEVVGFTQVHFDEVKSVAFDANEARILTAGEKRAVVLEVVDADEPDPQEEGRVRYYSFLEPDASWIDSAAWSAQGNLVVTAHQDGTARIFDIDRAEEIEVFRGHSSIVWTAEFSPDGTKVVTSGEDGSVLIWNVDTPVVVRHHTGPVLSAAFSSQGDRLVTAGTDAKAVVSDAATGREISELRGEEAEFGFYPVTSAEFSADGDRILMSQRVEPGVVSMWSVGSGEEILRCCAHPDGWAPLAAAFVPPVSERAAVLYRNGSLSIWSLADDSVLWTIGTDELDEHIIGAAVSPSGSRLVTLNRAGQAVLWDLRALNELGQWPVGLTSSIAFADDRRLVTATLDGTVRVWNLGDWDEAAEDPPRSPVAIRGVAGGSVLTGHVRDDRSWIVVGQPDGTTTVWDLDDGTLLGEMQHHNTGINAVSVASDGRVATAADDETVKVYECTVCIPIDEVVSRARELLATLNTTASAE